MSEIVDDKSPSCISFILERLKVHQANYEGDLHPPPFFLGLNGVQGAGKTTLVNEIKRTMEKVNGLSTVVFSMDDIYLTHDDQLKLAAKYPSNPLLQHRGQPGTHDVQLGLSVLSSLKKGLPTKIPQYNKAAFKGQGDRVPTSEWEEVNAASDKVKVVLFEGWCTGFRPLEPANLKEKWQQAVQAKEDGDYVGRLGYNKLEDVSVVNDALQSYNELTDSLDALIHIDTEDLQYVYEWRLQQETALRAAKGSGMTDEEVKHFVDGYYPSYELFTERLRAGIFQPEKGKQLSLVVDRDRKVKQVIHL